MSRRNAWIGTLLAAALITAPSVPAARPSENQADLADGAKSESASIVERKLDFFSFTYHTVGGTAFDLRDYAKGKNMLIIVYFAGWCPNSNRNGHIIQRLWTRYRERGLGVVGVAEYSSPDELRIHIGRIGIDYPVVVETRNRNQRKDSSHYKYRRAAGDNRKWGTPFYVIIEERDIEPAAASGPLARRVYTVCGEMVEDEAEQFIKRSLAKSEPR